MFEELKKKTRKKIELNNYEEINFILKFHEKNAYVEICDEDGNKINNVNYSGSDKLTKEIIQAMDLVKEENLFVINWGMSSKKVYLKENPFLLDLLKRSSKFKMESFKNIELRDKKYRLKMKLEKQEDGKLKSSFYFGKYKNFIFLNEKNVLIKNRIYEIEDIGEYFFNYDFNGNEFEESFLESYLSILYSYFTNIDLEYEDYELLFSGKFEAEPVLLIEKLGTDNSLYLKLAMHVADLEIDLLKEYELSKVASIDRVGKMVVISDIQGESLNTSSRFLVRVLNKCQKSLGVEDAYFFEEDLFIIEEKVAKEMISRELSQLLKRFRVLGSEKLKKYKVKVAKTKLITKLSHSINFLEGDVELEVEGEKFSLFDAIAMYKKDSYITLSDGTSALVNEKYIKKLEKIFKKKEGKARLSFFDLPLAIDLLDENFYQNELKKAKGFFDNFNNIAELKFKKTEIKASLREYQEYGYKWMSYLYEKELGACLADDMGLGKTIQALALLAAVYPVEKKPCLIIMPKSLIYNWENELNKFTDGISYCIYYGLKRDLNEAMKKNIIFTTYGTVRNDVLKLKEKEFNMVMLDESQSIKNINSQTTKSVMLLKAKRKFALSGTPIENNLSELYSLFRFLNPYMFGSAEEFNRNYALAIQKENSKEALEELKQKIYPFILRRTKKEVLKDLPEKIEQTLFVEMNKEHRRFYEERRKFYYELVNKEIKLNGINKTQFFILQALNELRQIVSSPESKSNERIISSKREALMGNLVDAVENGHKVLIFTNYIKSLEDIEKDLNKKKIPCLVMTGSSKNRQELVNTFQNDKTYKVFLMTLKTGGVGLNLTAADTIFIYDPWWNKSAENQAVDRSHRMGQDKTVFSYKLIVKNSIEEKMLSLQEKKTELLSGVISEEKSLIKKIDRDDIEYILGGSDD